MRLDDKTALVTGPASGSGPAIAVGFSAAGAKVIAVDRDPQGLSRQGHRHRHNGHGPLFASLPEKVRDGLIRAIPFRRLATPAEIADAVLFFASDHTRTTSPARYSASAAGSKWPAEHYPSFSDCDAHQAVRSVQAAPARSV